MNEWEQKVESAIQAVLELRVDNTIHHNAPAPIRKCCHENIVDWARKVIKEVTKC